MELYEKMVNYVKCRNVKPATELASNYPNDEFIQSQLMKLYVDEGNYESAKQIAKKFPNNESIQNQLMRIYIDENCYELAKKIAKLYPNNDHIQSQLIKIYIIEGNLEQAKSVALLFSENEVIQNQLISIYLKEKNREAIRNIASRFKDSCLIQNELMKICRDEKKYSECKIIAAKFPNYRPIQSQLMSIYYKENDYENACKIADKYFNDPIIQNQMISICIKNRKYKRASKIALRFPNNEEIQAKAERIKEYLPSNNESLLNIKYGIEELDEKIKIEDKKAVEILNNIRMKIVLNKISSNDFEIVDNLNISDNMKIIVKVAICEKIGNIKKATTFLKQLDNKKLYNVLNQTILKKEKIYNIGKWDSIIPWEILEIKEPEEIEVTEEVKKEEVKKELVSSNDELLTNNKKKNKETKKYTTGYMTKSDNISSKKVNKERIRKNSNITLYQSLNKDYKEMVLELKIHYYRNMFGMNKQNYILKWDRLEECLCSSVNDLKALKTLLFLLTELYQDQIKRDYPFDFEEINKKILAKKLEMKKQG